MLYEFLKQTGEAIQNFSIAIASFVMAFLMASFRTKRKHGETDWLEATMCGLFSIGAWAVLSWLKIPEIVAVGAASAIGYKGTHFVSKLIDKRTSGENNETDQ